MGWFNSLSNAYERLFGLFTMSCLTFKQWQDSICERFYGFYLFRYTVLGLRLVSKFGIKLWGLCCLRVRGDEEKMNDN